MSATHYDNMGTRSKGYVSYMQGLWNQDVPSDNPYGPGDSSVREEWEEGWSRAAEECSERQTSESS